MFFNSILNVLLLLQNFAKSMRGYESTLFNQLGDNELTVNVQSGLGIGISGDMVPWRPKANLSSIECSRVCSVISAYRLLDVVAMLGGAQAAPSIKRCHMEVSNASFRVRGILLT